MTKRGSFLLVLIPAVVGHLVLPVLLLSRVWNATGEGLVSWLAALFLAAGYLVFLYVVGAWAWFGGFVRHLSLCVLAVIAFASFGVVHANPVRTGTISGDSLMRFVMAIALGIMTVVALRGSRAGTAALDVTFPFRHGTFRVSQGGASRIINHHFSHPSQRYALDLLRLNALGLRAWGVYPRRLERYAIWGSEVVSPGDGVVTAAVDEFPDLSPPNRDPVHLPGNYVAIEIQGATVYLAHLQRKSVSVRVGQKVVAGQLIGLVGNSGNTTEPHLHIHVEAGPHCGISPGKAGIPISFGGRFLVRNDRVVCG